VAKCSLKRISAIRLRRYPGLLPARLISLICLLTANTLARFLAHVHVVRTWHGMHEGWGCGDTGTTFARRLSVPDLFSPAPHHSPVACRSPTFSPPPPLLLFFLLPHQDDIFTAALKSSSPKKTTLKRHMSRPSLSFVHSHGKNSKNLLKSSQAKC
jgi:hypothetical protein